MKKFFSFLIFSFLAFYIFATIAFAVGGVEINTASLQQLDEIIGIGPVIGQRIIDARPFSSLDDLLRVSGIGEKTLQKIKDQGLAYVGNQNDQIQPIIQSVAPSNNGANPTPNTQNPTPNVTYLGGVYINEVLPNPSGSDETDEWIELYNSNNSDVDLFGWQLQDKAGTITTYTIPSNPSTSSGQAKILANGFLVFKRPDTKIMLNNEGDGVNLMTPDEKIIDSVGFASAPLGQSYNKSSGDWVWGTTLTPGVKNIITAVSKAPSNRASARSGSGDLSNTKNSVKNNDAKLGLADISQSINQNQNTTSSPWFLFFTALAITIILAGAVLFIKFKLSKT